MGNSGSSMKKADLADLLTRTKFEEAELRDAFDNFTDENPSGLMWEETFIVMLKQGFEVFQPSADPRNYCRLLFKGFKGKKQHNITFAEYLVGLSRAVRGTRIEKIIWCFGVYDQYNSGKLTYDDFLVVQKEIYNMYGLHYDLPDDEATAELRCQKIFRLLSKDYNSDTISLEEFKQLCRLDYTLAILDRPLEGLASRIEKPFPDSIFSRDFQGNRVIDPVGI